MTLKSSIDNEIGEPERKRRFVRSLFGRVAGRYDLTNDVMSLGFHRRWKRRLLELAEIAPEHRVLDLAAGTGDLALGSGAAGLVVAVDLTLPMLEVGRGRRGSETVSWLCGDALRLPFPDASFDRVVIGYGLRNFADLRSGLEEIFRCLRPGGRLLALDFGKPSGALARRAYLRYLDLSTRIVGWLIHRDVAAYLYIPQSLRQFPGQEGVADGMAELGYGGSGYVDVLFGAMAINFGRRPE